MIRRLLNFVVYLLGLAARPFRLLWRALDFTRRAIPNLILLFVLLLIVAAVLQPGPSVPAGAALILRPSGALVEQTVGESALDGLFSPDGHARTTVLAGLLEAVRAAEEDPRIKLLVLETDDLDVAGLSKLAELRAAIADFKMSGKPVLARGERFSQGQYYLASVSDEIHLARDGFVLLQGLASFNTYFRDALDKIGVKMNVFRVGEYKSAAEPFVRNDMSRESRAAARELLDGLWARLRDDVIVARKLTPERFDAYAIHYRDALKATQGDAAEAARAAGLIDHFSSREQWQERIAERLRMTPGARFGKKYPRIEADGYLAAVRHERQRAPAQIAVLVAQGMIVDGDPQTAPDVVSGDSFVRLIREARENRRVKAIVVRIDSPGGSATASEVIREELELAKKSKPVVVSMSSLAASGGYWIATAGNEIIAEPATITGSIGIFAAIPDISSLYAKLGLSVDGVATAPLAAALDVRRPLAPEAAQALQLSIEHGYRRFIDIVATARHMQPEAVDRIARGRVWSGTEAVALGLIDRNGGLDAALAAAAKRANLGRYTVVWPAPEVSAMRQLGRLFMSASADSEAAASPAVRLVNTLAADLESLRFWNDPRHIYVHCQCVAP
ncbi:MAG: signal peptide peptidase SppA [Azoarcus sp.]|jgi:protease-4|nr:signal peptide peptidase SppA [Azoarcus sp.]